MFNLPYISPSRDLIYDLGLKEHSVELKSHATEAFYREHGMNGLLSLWMMSRLITLIMKRMTRALILRSNSQSIIKDHEHDA